MMGDLLRFLLISAAIGIIFACCNCEDEQVLFIDSRNGLRDGADLQARCRYRNAPVLYPPGEIWRYVTGANCYSYTVPSRLNYDLSFSSITYRNFSVPFIRFNETTPIIFDFEDESYVELIRGLFRTSRFFDLWVECCKLAVECCEEHLNATNVIPTETYVCPALWDGWDCWPPARADETLHRICPAHSYSSDDIVCEMESEKYCLESDWNHTTNYGGCASAPVLRKRHNYHVLVLTIATPLTFPAILIFFIFMTNQKDLRHVLHRNLLIAIVLKNVLAIISKQVIILDALAQKEYRNDVMVSNSVGCRVLSFFDTLATVSVFTCMLLVGYYLHSTIARVFGRQLTLSMVYLVSIICSLVPSLAWAIAMGATLQENCWVVDSDGFHWITDVYKFGVLVINLVLLVDIIRVICVQRSNLNTKQTRAAAKAIMVLVPLFGLPLLLTSQRSLIDQNSCLSGDIYYYVTYTVEALQGIVVALLFCYMNREVHAEMKKKYRKWIIGFNDRFGTNFKVPSQARVTTLTNVRPSGLDHPQRKSYQDTTKTDRLSEDTKFRRNESEM